MEAATVLRLLIFYAESAVDVDQEFLVEALCVALSNVEEPPQRE